jgi:tetratricopeptide (TPR) repeat protein
MSRPLRLGCVVALVVLAGWLVVRFAWEPWRCNVERRQLDARTAALWQRRGLSVREPARDNIRAARRCLAITPGNAALYAIAASNYVMLEDNATAADMYAAALRFDRRPELYYNLAATQLELARKPEAIENFTRAGLFNPYMILDIPADDIRAVVETAVAPRRPLPWRMR